MSKPLFTEAEIAQRLEVAAAYMRGQECEGHFKLGWKPLKGTGNEPQWTFHVIADPEIQVRIKPTPKRVPLEQKDWAGGPWWVKCGLHGTHYLVFEVDTSGMVGYGQNRHADAHVMMGCFRSRDCATWEPCSKEVEG